MSGQDSDASIKITADGVGDAARELSAFLTLLERARNLGTANPAASTAGGLPVGASTGTINPGDGLGPYSTSPSAGTPYAPTYSPPGFGSAPFPTTPYNLAPINPGNGLSWNNSGGIPGGGSGQQVVNAQTVIINGGGASGGGNNPPPSGFNLVNGRSAYPALIPDSTFGVDNGLGNIPGTPSAGGSFWNRVGQFFGGRGSNGGGMGPSMAGDGENPLPGWGADTHEAAWNSASRGWSSNILHSLGVPGELHQPIMDSLGDRLAPRMFGMNMSGGMGVAVGSGLLAASALTTEYGLSAMNAAYQDYKSNFDVQTQLSAAAAGGHFINDPTQMVMLQAGQMEGRFAEKNVGWNTLTSTIGSIPILGSIANGYLTPLLNQSIYNPQQRALALLQARAADDTNTQILESYGNVRDLNNVDQFRSDRASLAGSLAAFGPGAVDALMSTSVYATGSLRGIQPGQINSGISAAMSMALDPRNASLYNQAAAGGFADKSFLMSAAQQYAFQGDSGALGTMTPALKASGATSDDIASLQSFAAAIRSITNTINIAQSQMSSASSQAQAVGLTGGSYSQIGSALSGGISPANDALAAAQARLVDAQKTGNPTLIAQAQASVDQAKVTVDSLKSQSAEMKVSGIQARADTMGIRAGAEYQQVTSSGAGIDSTLSAFQDVSNAQHAGIEAKWAQVAQLRKYGNADEANKLAASARADEIALHIRNTAGRADVAYQYGSAQVGMQSASVEAGVQRASLYGGPEDIYKATMGRLAPLQQQYSLLQNRLDAGGIDQPTVDAIKSKQIELMQQENTLRTEAVRSLAQMNVSVAQVSQGLTQGNISIGAQSGLSGGEMGPLYAQGISQAGNTLSAAQANLNLLRKTNPENSQAVMQAKQAVQAAQSSILSAGQSQMSSGAGADVQLAQLNAGMDLSVLTGTYAGFGDVRGAIRTKMQADASSFQHYNSEYQNAGATAASEMKAFGANVPIDPTTGKPITVQDLTTSLQLTAGQGRAQALSAGVADQQQLQSGWMDRLISQTYNMPSRGAYVAAGFTQREAAQFTQGFSSAYGTTSAGAANAWRHYGDNIASSASAMDNVSNPMNFAGFAMNGMSHNIANARSAPNLATPGSQTPIIKIEVTVKDSKGNVVGRSANQGTIASINAGAIQITQSPHTAGNGSHQ